MIKCSGLFKSYEGNEILKDINVTVKEGEITVITGPSGSGKTTLLKCMSLLENPQSGEVVMDGILDARFPECYNREYIQQFPQVGIVFQNLFLWPHLTNEENIKLAFDYKLNADQLDYYNELVSAFKMGDFLYKYPNQSSLGQRQRVALVRTLILKPRFLFLDEITASLDIEQISALLLFLERLKRDGVGVVLVTHFLLFAQKAADQVVFMEDGRVQELGNRDVLFAPNTLRFKEFLNSLNNVIISI